MTIWIVWNSNYGGGKYFERAYGNKTSAEQYAKDKNQEQDSDQLYTEGYEVYE